MKNKNTAWFFGDSFTQNLAIQNGTNYQQYLNKVNIKSWTEIVSEFLNMEQKLVTKGGRSSQSIYFSCLNNFKNIKSGDWVFITNSPYIRTVGVNLEKQKISTFNNEQIINAFNLYKGDDLTCGMPVGEENIKILIDYLYTFVLPYNEIWDNYWVKNFKNLEYIFKEKNVNFLFWDYKLWNNFLSITEETNSNIIDDHWGEIGNHDFAQYIINKIKNEK